MQLFKAIEVRYIRLKTQRLLCLETENNGYVVKKNIANNID